MPERRKPLSGVSQHVATAAVAFGRYLQFLRSWQADPRRVGAVAPSSEALARLITHEIDPDAGEVLELGVGTGVFTTALIARGVPEQALTLVESGGDFACDLERRFPRARVLRMDATTIARSPLFPDATVAAVISGLPLLAMPKAGVRDVLAGAFGCLRPGGGFYQFTYGPMCPVPRATLEELGLEATRIGTTLRNLPPASVYRISRRATVGRPTGEEAGAGPTVTAISHPMR